MTKEETGIIFRQWRDAGDEAAFRVLYESFYHTLLNLASRYVPMEVARDIVQDVFMNMWNDPEKYVGVSDLRFYLYRSIQNKCINYLRDRKVEDKYRNGVNTVAEDFFYNALLEEDIFILMMDAISKLPDIYREVLSCSLEGLSDKEVSEKLKISVDNVKTRKKRGKSILKEALQHPLLLMVLNLI